MLQLLGPVGTQVQFSSKQQLDLQPEITLCGTSILVHHAESCQHVLGAVIHAQSQQTIPSPPDVQVTCTWTLLTPGHMDDSCRSSEATAAGAVIHPSHTAQQCQAQYHPTSASNAISNQYVAMNKKYQT